MFFENPVFIVIRVFLRWNKDEVLFCSWIWEKFCDNSFNFPFNLSSYFIRIMFIDCFLSIPLVYSLSMWSYYFFRLLVIKFLFVFWTSPLNFSYYIFIDYSYPFIQDWHKIILQDLIVVIKSPFTFNFNSTFNYNSIVKHLWFYWF